MPLKCPVTSVGLLTVCCSALVLADESADNALWTYMMLNWSSNSKDLSTCNFIFLEIFRIERFPVTCYLCIFFYTYTIHSKILKVTSESFIDPNVIPPSASDEIPKPFVGKLVGSNGTDVKFIHRVCLSFFV